MSHSSPSRPRLRWLTDVPRPYTSVLFRALAASEAVELEVFYGRPAMGTHPWSEPIDVGFASRLYSTTAGVDAGLVSLALRDRGSIFVIAGWNDLTMNGCALACKLAGTTYWIYSDTPDEEWLQRSALRGLARKTWLRSVLGGADRVFGTGRPALRRLQALGACEERLQNLPYFIDLDRYRSGPRAVGGPVVLGSAGQLVARKEISTALRALAQLRARGMREWRYRVVGTGPEENALRTLARELGIDDAVEFLGWLEGDALVEFFATCDVFVHPCEFEPWGVVVMEAMKSGAAVVCSDRTFVALDWLEPEESGLVHRAWDATDLAQKLGWLFSDRTRIARLGEAGRRIAEAWPVSRGVETVLRCAEEAIRQPSTRPG